MNDAQKLWFDTFLETGDDKRAVEVAYPNVAEVNRASKAGHLRTRFAAEIDKASREQYAQFAPLMLKTIKDLAINSQQDAVKLKAADTWLSRAGHDAALVIKDETPKSYDELLRNVQIALTGFDEDTISKLLPPELIQQLGAKDAQEETKH